MKKLIRLTILLTLLIMSSCATLVINYNNFPMTKDIVTKVNKDDAFVIANSWMIENFKHADNVIQYSDKEAGIIKGRYIIDLYQIGIQTDVETDIVPPKKGRIKSTPKKETGINPKVYTVKGIETIITIHVKDKITRISIEPQGIEVISFIQKNQINNILIDLSETLRITLTETVIDYDKYFKNYVIW